MMPFSNQHTVWRILAMCAPTLKEAEKRYNVSSKGSEFQFFHLLPNSFEWAKQQHPHSTPSEKEGKKLDLVGRKVFSQPDSSSIF